MNLINVEAEQQIIAGLLRQPARIIPLVKTEMLNDGHFSDHRSKQLFKIIMEMDSNGRLLHIKDIIRQPEITSMGDAKIANDISDIRSKFVGVEAWRSYLSPLKESSALRVAHYAANEALAMIETGQNPHEVASHFTGAAQNVSAITESSSAWKTSQQASQEFSEMFRKIHSPNETYGMPSGIDLIDKETGGLAPEDFWVIAAPSSCGKTLLMMQIANYFHAEGKHVLIFSFETSAAKLISRWIAARTGVNSKTILGKGDEVLTKHDMTRIVDATKKIQKSSSITICDNYDMTLESMMGVASQMREAGNPIDLIVTDYIQLIRMSNKDGKNREQEVAFVASNHKKMAKEHDCPVISASQLNDDGKVRESRAIVQDADVVLKIDPRGSILLAKNRDGERDHELPLVIDGRNQRFIFNQYHQDK